MKKILLATILTATIGFASAQCPNSFKSNAGGGNCPATYAGQQKTAKITFTYTGTPPNCLPRIIQVEDLQGVVFTGPVAPGVITGNGKTVEYCVYGTAPNNNFFNQPDLILTLKYPVNCPSTGDSAIARCGPDSEIPLPVLFQSFNANRQNSTVAITWSTASEQNNKGFYIQRNVAGEWKNIAFVFSLASGGNSTSVLSYEYKDVNTEKGISQYRIQQVDIDGNAKYTDIRAVRGEGQASKLIVYPNPSANGNVNVVFEDNNSLRDVQVSDIQGKIIRQYKQVGGNYLLIEKLTSGFYTLKVTNRTTAASSVQKVVVK